MVQGARYSDHGSLIKAVGADLPGMPKPCTKAEVCPYLGEHTGSLLHPY